MNWKKRMAPPIRRGFRPSRAALGFFLLLLFSFPSVAFADGAITGAVFDRETLIPVQGVQVALEGTESAARTDSEGRFRFSGLPDGTYNVIFQSMEYERVVREAKVAGGEVVIEIDLEKSKGDAVELEEVSVRGRRETPDVAKQTVSQEELKTLPGAGADAVRVVESLPGVANLGVISFGTPGLVIRGTGAEDSRYFMDGFDVPQLFHFGGLLTVVNSEWIESLDYYAGGYSVRYGDALGGIVELKSRLPDNEKAAGVVDLTNYASFVLLESPFDKEGRFSGGFAVRRSVIDYVLPEFIPEDEAKFTILPRFWDYQATAAYRPSVVHTFQIFAFGSDDGAGIISEQTNEESPTTTQSFDFEAWFHRQILSWTFTPSAAVNNRLGISPSFQSAKFTLFDDQFFKADLQQLELRNDLTIKLAKWNTLSVGAAVEDGIAKVEANIIRPPKEGDPAEGSIFNEQTALLEESVAMIGLSGYIEDVIDIGSFMQITPGFRATWLGGTTLDSDKDLQMYYVDPRLFTRLYLTDRATLKAGVGQYHQFPGPDELIEPFGTPDLEPENANAYSGGVEYQFDQGYSLDVQGYYKQLDNLVSPTEPDEEKPYDNEGVGRIYGAELLFRKELTDRLYGWLSYTYALSERRDRPDGDWRYFDQDQRHNVILLASYKIGEDWRFGGRFQYSTGMPYTEIDTAIYNVDSDSYIPIFSSDINEERAADFHQLDLRVDKLWRFTNWTFNTYLDVQNVYNQKQAIGYIYNHDYSEKKPVSFPIFYPTLGLQARF